MAPTGTITEGSQTSWPKWQIALVIGAPIAIGLGYWYLKRQPRKTTQSPPADSKPIAKTKVDKEQPTSLPKSKVDASVKLKNLGNKCFKSGNYAEAIEYYNKAIDACPKDNPSELSTFYQNRAAAFEQLKDFEKARNDCTTALELNPQYVKALHRRSKANESLGNLEESLEDVTAACIIENFQSESTLFLADRVLKALGRKHAKEAMPTRKPVMPSRQFVRTYFSSFQVDPCKTFNEAVQNGSGEHSNIMGYKKAQLAMKSQKYEDVMPACQEELDSDDGTHKDEALLLLATMCQLLGEHTKAMQHLTKIAENEKIDVKIRVNALIKRASLFMQMEQPDKCMDDFKTAENIDSENPDIYHHRGQVKLLLEDLHNAIADFNKAVRINPNFPIAYVQKCYTDFRFAYASKDMQKVRETTAKFEEAVQKFPKCTEACALYAQVLSEQEEYAKADKLYAKALEIDPENASLRVHRAILGLQWNQDTTKATDLIKEAIKLDDRCEFAYETLGTIEVQKGNLAEGIKLFNKAIPLAKTELELAHLYSLKDAAVAQEAVAKRMNIKMSLFA